MPTRLPSLPGLEAFEAVARLGSFTRAARALHVTQGAVSHRIRSLEEQLGCSLFVRRARGVALTDEGRALESSARAAFAHLREGVEAVGRAREGGAFTLSCSPSFAVRFLVPRLPAFRAAHPEVDLRIAADDRLVTPGRDGIDACLRYGAGGYPGVERTRLATERIGPVCAPHVARALRSPADLADRVLLHDEVLRDHPGRVGWRRWLEAAGVADAVDPDRGPRLSHVHMALEAAVAGQGVALGRTTLVRADLEAGRLVRPFSLELASGLSYWLLTPRGVEPPPRVAAFREWLLAEARAT
ncbi:MAG TPA: transcriptional regulator GcvA [Sandaracinaceae bacterium LLY-WYZ-13_1]|nr:transcriptional regulator GcvA [Sandaracinaceae bacterium LLY-WYZ-13_1]